MSSSSTAIAAAISKFNVQLSTTGPRMLRLPCEQNDVEIQEVPTRTLKLRSPRKSLFGSSLRGTNSWLRRGGIEDAA